jgi:hypothetical protein
MSELMSGGLMNSRLKVTAMLSDLNSVRILSALVVMVTVAIGMSMGEVINRDGIIYVNAAQAFLDGGLGASLQVYNWPFYSIFFASVSTITGLSLETAAHLVNAILMLIFVDAFLRLSHSLNAHDYRPWIPALVILGFPPLDHRLEIYRDWGYLAFSLCAIVALVRFWKASQGRQADALAWQGYMVMALLFRVETVGLIVLTPLALLFQDQPWKQRIRRFIAMNYLIWIFMALVLGLILSGVVPAGKLTDLAMYLDPQKVLGDFKQTAEQISTHALNKYTDDYAQLILMSGIFAMVGWMFLDNLGVFLLLVTAVGLARYKQPRFDSHRLVYWLLAVVFVVLLVFLAVKMLAISRFALLGSVLLLLFAVYYVTQFATDRNSGHRVWKFWWVFVLTGLILANLVSLIARPDYKGYIREGGVWIHDNLPMEVPLISNDYIIDYYAGRPHGEKLDSMEKIEKALGNSQPPYFVALKSDDDEKAYFQGLFKNPPIAVFRSNRADESLLIFEVK